MTPPIIARDWYCPRCQARAQLPLPRRGQTHMHTCPGLRMLSAPLYPVGVAAKVELREPEDYIGREIVQRDPELNRPVQSVVTTRDDGTDTLVYAPMATAQGDT